jgi:hypothetical protein
MTALIIGDLVNSASTDPGQWMPVLKRFLKQQGKSPADWEIFRGDSFQFRCKPEEAFGAYLLLKSMIRQIRGLDVRVSIGIGAVEYDAAKITESNGTAFVRAGRTFDALKEKQYLAFCTGDDKTDEMLNLFGRFASLVTDHWTASVSETVQMILEHPGWNQQQVADKLKIRQSAVSQNRTRARLDLLTDLNAYYVKTVTVLIP